MAWAYGAYTLGRLLSLVAVAVLARVLTPEAFGIVAVASVFILLLETLSDLGLTSALVVADDDEDEAADTVLAACLGVGVLIVVLLSVTAPLLADAFDEPQLVAVLPVLSFTVLMRQVGSTHYALAHKRLDFRARAAAEMGDVLARGLVGIALALLGAGVWSLVLGQVAGAVLFSAVLWLAVPWKPGWHPRLRCLRRMIRFGGTLTAVNLLAVIIGNVDYVVVGRVLGTEALGYYTMAFKLPELLIMNVAVVAGRVLFPAFAALSRSELATAVVRSIFCSLAVCLPLAVMLAVLADDVIALAFGTRWLPAVPSMQLLTIYVLAVAMGIPAGSALKATGRADVLLALAVPRAILAVIAIVAVAGDGIVRVAGAQAAVALVFAVAGMVVLRRSLVLPVQAVLRALWPPAAAAAVLAVVLLALRVVVDDQLLRVVVGPLVGAAAYSGTLRAVAPEQVAVVLGHLRRTVGR